MFAVSGLLSALVFGMVAAQYYPNRPAYYDYRYHNANEMPMPPAVYYPAPNPPRYPPRLPVVVQKPVPVVVKPVEVKAEEAHSKEDKVEIVPNMVVGDKTVEEVAHTNDEKVSVNDAEKKVEQSSPESTSVEKTVESKVEEVPSGGSTSDQQSVENAEANNNSEVSVEVEDTVQKPEDTDTGSAEHVDDGLVSEEAGIDRDEVPDRYQPLETVDPSQVHVEPLPIPSTSSNEDDNSVSTVAPVIEEAEELMSTPEYESTTPATTESDEFE